MFTQSRQQSLQSRFIYCHYGSKNSYSKVIGSEVYFLEKPQKEVLKTHAISSFVGAVGRRGRQ